MSRINAEVRDFMFDRAGVSHERFVAALLAMGPKQLKTKQMREAWRADNPTRNYCYVIAQFVYCYCAPHGSTAWKLDLPDEAETFNYRHYFVKWPNGVLVDLAAEQFADYDKVLNVIGGATRATFFPPWPDTRTRMLAQLCGFNTPLRASGARDAKPAQPALFR